MLKRMLLALQFAFNTLSRVSPVSHGVCNVVKRVVIIATSVVFFGTTLTPNTKIGQPCFKTHVHKPPLFVALLARHLQAADDSSVC